MNTIYLVIVNAGDGSNFIEYYCDPASIAYLEELMADGKMNWLELERYASGDGLQVTTLSINMDLDEFANINAIHWADAELVHSRVDDLEQSVRSININIPRGR
jgi:hypothetical protein